MAFQRQASCICCLFLSWTFSATLGEERCRVAGGGSCINPLSRALLTDTTASMLQLMVERQVPTSKAGSPRESDIDEVAAALEEGVETQMGAAAQDAISGLEQFGDDIVKAEKEMEEAAPAKIDELAAEATEVAGEQIEEAKVEGLETVQGASNATVSKIDAVADSVESKLSEAELQLKASKDAVDGVMSEGIHEADVAIDSTVKLLKDTIKSVAPNEGLKKDFSERFERAVQPYVAVAKGSLQAEKEEVNAVLSEISRETGDLGEEFQGVAGQVAQETRSGVNAVVAGVAS